MRSNNDPALVARGLRKGYGGTSILCGVDMEAAPGRITAIIGPNGAGKTTLFHAMTGDVRLDEGEVRLGSRSLRGLSPWRVARAGLGKLFQDVRPFATLSAGENVAAALDDPWEQSPLWSLIHPFARRRERFARAEALLDDIGVEGDRRRPVSEMSYGNQKLVALARLMAGGFRVLLLDEPAAGLSPPAILRLGEYLTRAASEQGLSIVLIEHDLAFVREFAHRVYVLQEGKVVASGPPREVLGRASIGGMMLGI